VEQRRSLGADKVRLTHRRTDALQPDFPQVLAWCKDQDTLVFGAFRTRWPTLKPAQQARQARLTAFFPAHHGRDPHIIAPRSQAIRRATPLTTDRGVIRPNQWLVEGLVQPQR
jgi:hypothetical protein